MLWEIAHNQGLKLPTKDYWEFEKMVTMYESKPYEEYLLLYDLTEKIQSSPEALFTAAETSVSGAYRKNNITTLELRFNPILRARGGERDLDHLIVFALQGMERAMLKYPVRCGIILMMDRRLTHDQNTAIVKKAVKYHARGIVGIDLAGPVKRDDASKFNPKDITDLTDLARSEGLGITVHTGEATNVDEMWDVVNFLKPDRIGHGIAAVNDEKLMSHLSENQIVLETCPTSNLNTRLIKDFDQMRQIYRTLLDHHVPFTVNTDGPEMQRISLKREYFKLLENSILTEDELLKANEIARSASFIGRTKSNEKTYFL
jgi:adenosine deaminase